MNPSSKDALADLRNKIAQIEDASFSSASTKTASRPHLSDAGADEIAEDAPEELLKKAKKKIERLCAVRERCTSEVSERLHREEFPEGVVEEAVAWAVRCGFIDDARFADVFVRSRLAAGLRLHSRHRAHRHVGDPLSRLADPALLVPKHRALRAMGAAHPLHHLGTPARMARHHASETAHRQPP